MVEKGIKRQQCKIQVMEASNKPTQNGAGLACCPEGSAQCLCLVQACVV